MPFPAYSIVLWDLTPPYTITGGDTVEGPGPPGGLTWVIREVVAVNLGTPFGGASSWAQLVVGDGNVVWSTPPNKTLLQYPYEARDVRFVISGSEPMSLITTGLLWNMRVSGYQLTS